MDLALNQALPLAQNFQLARREEPGARLGNWHQDYCSTYYTCCILIHSDKAKLTHNSNIQLMDTSSSSLISTGRDLMEVIMPQLWSTMDLGVFWTTHCDENLLAHVH